MTWFILMMVAYAAGSLVTGKWIGNAVGVDIQRVGSGNIGFANAVRAFGWPLAWVVLVVDVAKGFLPVWLASQWLAGPQLWLVALAAVLGHVFPVWLRGRGGKGIATGAGVTLALAPWMVVPAAAVYGAGFAIFRHSAPASLVVAWSMAVWCLVYVPALSMLYVGLALVATWTHRTNVRHRRLTGSWAWEVAHD